MNMLKTVLVLFAVLASVSARAETNVAPTEAESPYVFDLSAFTDDAGASAGTNAAPPVVEAVDESDAIPLAVATCEAGIAESVADEEDDGDAVLETVGNMLCALTNAAAMRTEPYLMVDLSAGPTAARYPVVSLATNAVLPGLSEYTGAKLLLRRIEPGESPVWGSKITRPFYIGVFEITEEQWALVTATSAVQMVTGSCARAGVSYDMIRGKTLGARWPESGEVDPDSFLGRLRARTGIDFDLPTEAQWEYACRAGTKSSFNNGGNGDADMAQLGSYWRLGKSGYFHWRFVYGQTPGRCPVGQFKPNKWGLYDMHGGVWEWCRDWYEISLTMAGADPVGAKTGKYRVLRGGSYRSVLNSCTSASRGCDRPEVPRMYGLRIMCPTGGER